MDASKTYMENYIKRFPKIAMGPKIFWWLFLVQDRLGYINGRKVLSVVKQVKNIKPINKTK